MYLFDNELFAIECVAKYAMEGLDVKEGGVHDGRTDQFAHCPYPRPKGQKHKLPGDLGYWLTFYDHQHQGLLQSVDVGRKCYFAPDVKLYLDTFPEGFFELYEIYDEFNAHTEDWKERRSGKKHPMYNKTGALHHRSRAIIVIKPDGTKLHFGGVNEAARKLGIDQANLSGYFLKKGHVVTQRKWKGYQFLYEVKE